MQPEPCRSCGSLVYWLTSPKSRQRMPVDAVPHGFAGTVRVDLAAGTFEVLGRDAAAEARKTEQLHRSHFATCSSPERHRKPRKAKS